MVDQLFVADAGDAHVGVAVAVLVVIAADVDLAVAVVVFVVADLVAGRVDQGVVIVAVAATEHASGRRADDRHGHIAELVAVLVALLVDLAVAVVIRVVAHLGHARVDALDLVVAVALLDGGVGRGARAAEALLDVQTVAVAVVVQVVLFAAARAGLVDDVVAVVVDAIADLGRAGLDGDGVIGAVAALGRGVGAGARAQALGQVQTEAVAVAVEVEVHTTQRVLVVLVVLAFVVLVAVVVDVVVADLGHTRVGVIVEVVAVAAALDASSRRRVADDQRQVAVAVLVLVAAVVGDAVAVVVLAVADLRALALVDVRIQVVAVAGAVLADGRVAHGQHVAVAVAVLIVVAAFVRLAIAVVVRVVAELGDHRVDRSVLVVAVAVVGGLGQALGFTEALSGQAVIAEAIVVAVRPEVVAAHRAFVVLAAVAVVVLAIAADLSLGGVDVAVAVIAVAAAGGADGRGADDLDQRVAVAVLVLIAAVVHHAIAVVVDVVADLDHGRIDGRIAILAVARVDGLEGVLGLAQALMRGRAPLVVVAVVEVGRAVGGVDVVARVVAVVVVGRVAGLLVAGVDLGIIVHAVAAAVRADLGLAHGDDLGVAVGVAVLVAVFVGLAIRVVVLVVADLFTGGVDLRIFVIAVAGTLGADRDGLGLRIVLDVRVAVVVGVVVAAFVGGAIAVVVDVVARLGRGRIDHGHGVITVAGFGRLEGALSHADALEGGGAPGVGVQVGEEVAATLGVQVIGRAVAVVVGGLGDALFGHAGVDVLGAVVAVARHGGLEGAADRAQALGLAGAVVVRVQILVVLDAADRVLLVLHAVAVVVLVVLADLGGARVDRAVVVAAVVAGNLLEGLGGDGAAAALGALHDHHGLVAVQIAVVVTALVGLAVAVVVQAVADLGAGVITAAGAQVVAVGHAIEVVVLAVVADLTLGAADGHVELGAVERTGHIHDQVVLHARACGKVQGRGAVDDGRGADAAGGIAALVGGLEHEDPRLGVVDVGELHRDRPTLGALEAVGDLLAVVLGVAQITGVGLHALGRVTAIGDQVLGRVVALELRLRIAQAGVGVAAVAALEALVGGAGAAIVAVLVLGAVGETVVEEVEDPLHQGQGRVARFSDAAEEHRRANRAVGRGLVVMTDVDPELLDARVAQQVAGALDVGLAADLIVEVVVGEALRVAPVEDLGRVVGVVVDAVAVQGAGDAVGRRIQQPGDLEEGMQGRGLVERPGVAAFEIDATLAAGGEVALQGGDLVVLQDVVVRIDAEQHEDRVKGLQIRIEGDVVDDLDDLARGALDGRDQGL